MHFEELPREFAEANEAPKGRDYFYCCEACGAIVPSLPKAATHCDCGLLSVSVKHASHRDVEKFVVLKMSKSR